MVLLGWVVMAVVAYASMWISRLVEIRGTHPLEAMMVGIVLGAAVRNTGLISKKWEPHLKKFETPLLWGVVLLGAGFSVGLVRELPLSLVVIFSAMAAGFFFIYFLGRKIGLPEKLCILLGVGTTICGGSAIAITAPLIKAKEEDVSYPVSTIVIAAFIMLITLPFLGRAAGLSQTAFGVWAGSAVHNTPQTIGTGFIFGDEAGQVATMVKLVRNMFMILVALMVSVWYGAKEASEKKMGMSALVKAFPWFLFGYIAIAAFAVSGFFTAEGVSFFNSAGRFLILMGMVGIGFGTNLRDIKRLGFKPLGLGILGAGVVASIGFVLVKLIGF